MCVGLETGLGLGLLRIRVGVRTCVGVMFRVGI